MVMPCSRSARRPSVSSARSTYSSPRRPETCSTCSSWSSKICLVSRSRRPISVLLPSSTEPAVAKRSNSIRTVDSTPAQRQARGAPKASVASPSLEVPLALAIFHRRLGELVVGARRATLRDARRRDLRDHLLDGDRRRLDRARARRVPHGAVPHQHLLGLVALHQRD